jgi:DNA-binding Lrp family transcriptional regulator
VDQLDINILKRLSKNCRLPFETISRLEHVSSPTIKRRIKTLALSGILKRWIIRLNSSFANLNEVLLLVSTDGSEDKGSFIKHIGGNRCTESLRTMSSDRYLIRGMCHDLNDLTALEKHIRSDRAVLSIEMHPLHTSPKHNGRLSKMQIDLLRHLIKDPRMKTSRIASLVGRSAKGTGLAINRLIDRNMVDFTIRTGFCILFIKARYRRTQVTDLSFPAWIEDNIPCLWEYSYSTIEPVVFASFVTERISEIGKVQHNLKISPYIYAIETSIGEQEMEFDSIRSKALVDLVA